MTGQDSTSGWSNGQPDYGVNPFSLQQSTPINLFVGQYAPGDLDDSGNTGEDSFAIIYSKRADNSPGMVTPSEFSGVVATVVDFYLSFPGDAPPTDGESLGELVQDAMFETLNREDYYGLTVGTGLVYNNEMTSEFGPMAFGGNNWRKLARFTILMRLLTNGVN